MNKTIALLLCVATSSYAAQDLSFSVQMRKAYEEGDAKTVAYLQQQQNTNLCMNAEEPPQTVFSFLKDLNTRESYVTQMSEQLSELTLQKTSGPIKKNSNNKRKVRIKNPQGIQPEKRVRIKNRKGIEQLIQHQRLNDIHKAIQAGEFNKIDIIARKGATEKEAEFLWSAALNEVVELPGERTDFPKQLEAFKYYLDCGGRPTTGMVDDLMERGLASYILPILRQKNSILSCCRNKAQAFGDMIVFNYGEDADEKDFCQIAEIMMQRGMDPNEECKDDNTILMDAVGIGKRHLVKLLLENNARVNDQDKCRSTALMRAACNAHPEVVTLLLQNGARVDLTNSDGHTALDLVISNSEDANQVRKLLHDALTSGNSETTTSHEAKMPDEDGDAPMSGQ